MGGLVFVAVSGAVTGLVLVWIARWLAAPPAGWVETMRRLLAARTFAEAEVGDEVLLDGVIVESEDTGIVAPIHKQKAVYVEIEATEERSSNSEASFERVFTEKASVPFQLSLADRRCVSVEIPLGADLEGLPETCTGPVVKPSAALAEFLTVRGRKPPDDGEFVRRREYTERVLAVGHHLVVLGRRRERVPPSRHPTYRGHEGSAYVEVSFADAKHSGDEIVARGRPERATGVFVGLAVALLVPVSSLVAHQLGVIPSMEFGLTLALLGVPIGTFLLWLASGFVAAFFD